MWKVLRWATTTSAFVAVAFVVFYIAVLPMLGEAHENTDLDGLKGDPERGQYLVAAAGCIACHTDTDNKGEFLAGGPALKTPFGTFYGPNITPDTEHGIGGWTVSEFAKALKAGLSPAGDHYFPAFPYTSYAAMSAQDIIDLKSYLDTVPAVAKPSRPHDIAWPLSDRRLIGAWKAIHFEPAKFEADPNQSDSWNRGAYLVNVLGHCGECHTQRTFLGGKTGPTHAGNSRGPGGSKIPGIRQLRTEDGGTWSRDDVEMALQIGMKPSGDFMGDVMAEVVEHSTAKLTDADRAAVAEYLMSLK
jgi:mono/diheme cytochrome c family protein